MLLMRLMHVDMRLQVSHLVVCTDVSELGGGLCYSTGLTRCGDVQACALACSRECAMAKPWWEQFQHGPGRAHCVIYILHCCC